jgi:hypothetical protein
MELSDSEASSKHNMSSSSSSDDDSSSQSSEQLLPLLLDDDPVIYLGTGLAFNDEARRELRADLSALGLDAEARRPQATSRPRRRQSDKRVCAGPVHD